MSLMKAIRAISSKILDLLGLIISTSSPQTSFDQKKPPRKIAVFTEGQTEQIFVEKLLAAMVGAKGLSIEARKSHGGRKFPRTSYLIRSTVPHEEVLYFAMIIDCGTDGRVTSDVREQYAGLIASGYEAILALRDVRPDFTLADVPRMKLAFSRVLPQHPIAPQLILAALEVEAWFLADHSHFARIDAVLTPQFIEVNLGVDPVSWAVEAIPAPADFLNQVYALAGLAYTKSGSEVKRTVDAMDFRLVLNDLPAMAPNFAPLKTALSEFFLART
jgi:hypothetical protein